MTLANVNIPSQQSAGLLFHHLILAVGMVVMLMIGTDFISIVLWQHPMAKKVEVILLIPLLAITLLYFKHFIRGVLASPEIALMVLFAVLSIVWSDYPRHTIQRCIPLVVTSAFALALGSMMSLRGLLLFISIFFAATMLLSLGAIIALPQARGIPPWDDVWNGIYVHKNGFGLAAALGMVSCYYASWQFTGRLKAVFVAGLVLSLFLLVMSQSRTSQIVAILSMSAMLASQIMPKRETIWAITYILSSAFMVGVVTFILASPIAEPIFGLIGRKPTLSDRIPTWELVWPFVTERFWVGYGYAAHWYEEGTYALYYAMKLEYPPHYSHNGLLETFLNVGFVGVILLFCAFFRLFFSVFYCMRYIPQRDAFVFVFVLGMLYFFSNITESSILSRLSDSWMFFVAYGTKISLVAKALRRSARLQGGSVV
ncbi:O-antigen ligase family protein [Ruegeria atlantica]|uniref:O-antigen ligase family protein n=1 Tax=Ruegeria atlantica TaxID=81569 RepID=UPI0014819D61|nr:O-antigen ligase family protein [Ruegeria atlantica]